MKRSPVSLVCPRCRASVEDHADHFRCSSCPAVYPVVEEIPDFRIAPDPWIGIEDDRDKARRLSRSSRDLGFEDTVRCYWRMTPETAPEQARRFIDHVLAAERRSREWLAELQLPPGPDLEGPWLDIGCGTADLEAAAPPTAAMVGVDIALRWLVVARKRLQEAGVASHLVCANAEALPFAPGAFSVALSLGTLEHCRDKRSVLEEARRVLRPGGCFHLRTVNRFSLLSESHVGFWGIGYLPRSWADTYVRWRGGRGYNLHHPVGGSMLRRFLVEAGFRDVVVDAARSLPAEVVRMGRLARSLLPLYQAARRQPGTRRIVRLVAPLLEARGCAP